MKNIPYDKDCPLQRVEEGDAVEISVMHFPNKLVRDKDVKKYGHIPDGVYHAVAVAPYKLKCEQHPELSGYYNYWYGDKRGCSDGIYATECSNEDNKEVIGRVGSSHSTEDGKEVTTYFNEYIGDNSPNANWKSCVVKTDSIQPYKL